MTKLRTVMLAITCCEVSVAVGRYPYWDQCHVYQTRTRKLASTNLTSAFQLVGELLCNRSNSEGRNSFTLYYLTFWNKYPITAYLKKTSAVFHQMVEKRLGVGNLWRQCYVDIICLWYQTKILMWSASVKNLQSYVDKVGLAAWMRNITWAVHQKKAKQNFPKETTSNGGIPTVGVIYFSDTCQTELTSFVGFYTKKLIEVKDQHGRNAFATVTPGNDRIPMSGCSH